MTIESRFVAVGVLALGSMVASNAHAATIVLDQSVVGPLSLFQGIGHTPGSSGNPVVAQSFTVGIAGMLSSVDVFISNQGNGTTGTDLVAEIFAAAAGAPTGGALASVTISESLIPGGGSSFFNINFSAFGLGISVGDTLAILLRESDANPSTVFVWAGSNTDVYAGGMDALDIGTGWMSTDSDLYFRTYVETPETPVPEPATLLLLGTGLAAAGVRRRMKKRG